LAKQKLFVYLRPVLQVVLLNITKTKSIQQCQVKREHISPQKGKERISMALESVWQPLMVEKFFQEEELKEEKNYQYPLS